MNREILFRGKSIHHTHRDPHSGERLGIGDWVYGYFVNCASQFDDPKDTVPEIIEIGADRIYTGEYSYLDAHAVDLETVSQWTGMTDKNGVKIFEGDIIKCVTFGFDTEVFVTEVKYGPRRGGLGFYLANGRNMFYFGQTDMTKMDDSEVVGNIWDNPEMLGG